MKKQIKLSNIYTLLFYNKNYFLFYMGWTISLFGSSLTKIALPILVLERTGSGFAMGMTFALETIPSTIFGPLLGVISDRYNRKLLIIMSDVLRALILIVILFSESLYLIFALIFLMGTLKALYVPVRSAIIPELVSKEKFPDIIVFQGTTQRIINIVGPSLAAVIIGFTSPTYALNLDIATYIIAALFSVFVAIPAYKVKKNKTILSDMKEGIAFLFTNPLIRKLNLYWIILNFGFGGLTVLLLLYLEETNVNNALYGLLMTVLTIGMLVGTLLASKIKETYKEKIVDILPLTFGISYLFLLFDIGISFLFVMVFLLGLNFGLFNVIASILFGINIPNEIRGRVYANATAFTTSAFSLSAVLSGFLKDSISVPVIFFGIGLTVFLVSLLIILYHNKKDKKQVVKKALN